MPMTYRPSNLLFLLAAAPLALPGCDPDRSDGDDGAQPSGSSTTADPEAPTTGGTSSNGTTAPPDADSGSTAGADGADGESTTGAGPGGIPPACEPYADTTIPCYGTSLEGLKVCTTMYATAEYVGADCIEAFIDYFACLSQSSCEAVADDCPDEADAYNTTCRLV